MHRGFSKADVLHDLGTLSSANVPIAKYVATHGRYVIHAWLPPQGAVAPNNTRSRPSTIVISSRDTSGTYPGDAAPNDSVELDLGPRVSLRCNHYRHHPGCFRIETNSSSRLTWCVAYDTRSVFRDGLTSVPHADDDGFIGESSAVLTHRSLGHLLVTTPSSAIIWVSYSINRV